MDDMRDGFSSAFKELQRGFSFGFGLLPELERHMAREMQRLYEAESRWAPSSDSFLQSFYACERNSPNQAPD